MSDSNKDVKFSFKVLINKQKTKVLFAEIDSHFADVLLSFLTLPLGKIVRKLKKHYGDEAPVFGSLTTLYDGLSNLDEANFSAEGCKQMLLNPASSFSNECRKLKLDIGDTQPTKYFSCEDWNCRYCYIGMYHGTARCPCGNLLKREIYVRNASEVAGEIFTKSNSSFILSDDLDILPHTTTTVRKMLSNLGLVNLDGTELRNVTFGINEIMELLWGSLLENHSPLTKVILKNQTKYKGAVPIQIENIEASTEEGLIIKAILKKSTNKLLFVEAGEDFVEFLFSLLTTPLGKVEYLLCGNTCMKNIENLYGSIAFPKEGLFLRDAERSRLINPTIPYGYGSKKKIFSVEEIYPQLSMKYDALKNEEYLFPEVKIWGDCNFNSPKGNKDFLNGSRRYMVKDDLTVTALCMASYISTMIEQEIPLPDVDEKMLKIGLQEASSILKSSLTSTCALSNGLNHLLMKQPKQDKSVKQEH